MNIALRPSRSSHIPTLGAGVDVVSRAELVRCRRWVNAFHSQRKDHRYYEILEDTIPDYDYRYFVVRDASGVVRAVEPFFLVDQDILAGTNGWRNRAAAAVRRLWPRFLRIRTLMIGCAAGEGHLDDDDQLSRSDQARLLAAAVTKHAARFGAHLVVLKEFPAKYRTELSCFLRAGYTRIPSMPMTRLNIDYENFDDYATRALSRQMRKNLRQKRLAAQSGPAIKLEVMRDITPFIDDVYPLYLQVYARSRLRFERLTKDYFCRIGRLMPDKARFFIWRRQGKVIAFASCLVQGDEIYGEYLGFDYSVALELHLYHNVMRDVISWAIEHGYKWFRSSGLNYDPKYHFRHRLDPIDLYVRHTSPTVNAMLKRVLPLIEPTRHDPTLRRFPNYDELWGEPGGMAGVQLGLTEI
jgi:predicted N-acyltransferase